MPWDFDPHHSLVEFRARHLGLALLQGTFSRMNVQVDVNEVDITKSSFGAVIDASSVDVHYERATQVFKSEAHFDVARYPEIRFQSKRIEPRGDQYAVMGELSLHGVTREITWEGTYNGEVVGDHFGRTRRGYSLTTVINLKDFGVPGGGRSGRPDDDLVRVNLEIELLKRADGEVEAPRRSRRATA
jgi:polyisoprenoid-binding protein YceI